MGIESDNFMNICAKPQAYAAQASNGDKTQVVAQPNQNQPKMTSPIEKDTVQLSNKPQKPAFTGKQKGIIATAAAVIAGTVILIATKGKNKKVLQEVENNAAKELAEKTLKEEAEKAEALAAKELAEKEAKNAADKAAKEAEKLAEKTAKDKADKVAKEAAQKAEELAKKEAADKAAKDAAKNSEINLENEIRTHIDKTQKTIDAEKPGWENYLYNVHSPDAYSEAIKTGGFKVKNVLAVGGESTVFELEDGNILKLACRPSYADANKLYAPEIKRGIIKLEDSHYTYNKEVNNVCYVVQKKGELGVAKADIENFVKNEVEKSGYKVSDFRDDQFAYFLNDKGEKVVKAIDLGCLMKSGDLYTFEELTEAAVKPAGKERDSVVFETLKDKIFNKSFDYSTNNKMVKKMVSDVNEKVEKGSTLMDAVDSVLKENNKDPLKRF